jgi:hypothetical protein
MRLFSFWSFAPFGYLERLCLASMIQAGHTVDVYSYDTDLDLPSGAILKDASEVVPRSKVTFHRLGPSHFTDIFRYEGLRRGFGTWVDMDVLMLRSIADMTGPIMGWENPNSIAIGVLWLQPDDPFLAHMKRLAAARVPIPGHLSWRKKLDQIGRALAGRQRSLNQFGRCVIGPAEFTDFLRRSNRIHLAQPADVFYPLPHKKYAMLFDPSANVEGFITPRTRAVHLWNNSIVQSGLLKSDPPRRSFIARMCDKYGIEPHHSPHADSNGSARLVGMVPA